MKSKGFTLIELIAVLVIMSILTLIATPNVITLMNNSKEDDFMSDVRTMVSKALVIYKQNPDNSTVSLSQLSGIEDTDAYGYKYTTVNIRFTEPETSSETTTPQERLITVNIKSCKGDRCHCFNNVRTTMEKIDVDSSGKKVKVVDCN